MRGILAAIIAVLVAPALAPGAAAADLAAQQNLVDESRAVVEHLKTDPKLGSKARELIRKSRAVLVIPELVKAGLIFGGQGGSGVLLARDAKGKWSDPCFYDLGGGSFGLQIGGQVSKVVLVVMTDAALDNILRGEVKLGGGAGATVAQMATDTDASAVRGTTDIYSVAESEGFFAGATVEGASLSPDKDRNKTYYGREVTPNEVLMQRSVTNPGAAALKDSLAKF
jgi:lipid-binding SYLF domain-containing protein